MTKSKKSMSMLLSDACKEACAGNMKLKESIWHNANKFINDVENPVQECCYDILQLPITSSRKKELISTCNSHGRVFITKSQQILQQLDPDSKDVKLKKQHWQIYDMT